MFFFVREILRSTPARHCGQRKIGIAGMSIREVAREQEDDMELDSPPPGAETDLNASAHDPSTRSRRMRPPPQSSPSVALPLDAVLSHAAPGSLLPTASPPTSARGRLQPSLYEPTRRKMSSPTHRCKIRWRAPSLLQHRLGATVFYWVPQAEAATVLFWVPQATVWSTKQGPSQSSSGSHKSASNRDGKGHRMSPCTQARGKTEHHFALRAKLRSWTQLRAA